MPRLSVVVVAHREQGFIRACLTSILDQPLADRDAVEVLVVDDASADHSGDIARELASADPRLQVVEPGSRLGPGPAQLAGAAQGRGAYVWFVDAHDLLAPDALARVLPALDPQPDALAVGHTRLDVFARRRDVPPPAGGRTARLWDTVLRAGLLRDARVAAGPGWEAELAATLLSGARVAVLPEPAYVRRDLPATVRRDPAAPASPSAPVGRRATGLLRRAVRTVRQVRRLRRVVRTAPRSLYYALQRRRPLDPSLAVFAAYWYAGYSCNPRAIYEKARDEAPWVRGVWVVEADKAAAMPPGVEHVVAGSRAYYRLMARATYFINNVNFPNHFAKRPGQVFLQTHHGTPLKTMGMDLVTSPWSRKRLNFPKLMQRVATWDYSISQNAFTSEVWERVYPSGTYRRLETGYPRNDYLVNAGPEQVARARAGLGIEPGRTVVLYLPTHREYHPAYVPQLDPAALVEALGEEYVLLVRAHYFYREAQTGADHAPGRVIDVAGHPRIEDLYLAADVLVTDYSSAMFDYAVLDRPVVIYAPDWEEYRTKRGTTFDLMAMPPGPVATSQPALAQVLGARRAWDDESTALRAAFRARFCSLEDGKAADRVVHALWPAPPVARGGPA